MPCRALEAFRRTRTTREAPDVDLRLNALSGIGGVQTPAGGSPPRGYENCLNALSGIGGVQTYPTCLNALSGIGGVQTQSAGAGSPTAAES